MHAEHVVLVRAFEGQPLKRIVVRATDDILYVANPQGLDRVLAGESKAIGFRRQDCFAWSEQAFERLAKAYAAKSRTDMAEWADVRAFAGHAIAPRS